MDSEPEAHKFCIIIGAGAGGLIQAAELLRKKVLRLQDIQILERNSDYGGVWKAATYPGAACDVFSCTYQVSWHRNPDWNYLFPTASELVQYYRNFAKYFNITDCTLFNQSVTRATWSEERSLWVVDVLDGRSGTHKRWTCRVLVQAAGTYNRISTPQIPGMDRFKGDMWHASEWPMHYDFTGKTVAYVGTGPTSVQVLPCIQSQAKSVKVFCRSMTYCHPFNNFKYPASVKWVFRWVPGVLALYAFLVANLFAIWAYFAFRPESWIAKNTERYCRRHLKRQVSDPILLQQLTPTGRFGSKRPLVSLSGFFETLQKNNVEIDEPEVDGHSSTASQTKEQHSHIEADIIIWGTGFKMQGWGGAIPTIGRNGQLLSEHWRDSPNALYGTMTSAFPNLIFVNGPNTTTPWGSLIQGLEMQSAFNRKVIQLIHQKSVNNACYALEPRQDMEEAWTTSMQAGLNKLATSLEYGPAFYYLNEKGQNTFFFPWTQQYYRWKTRTLNVAQYVESGMAEF
ncbi:flavin-binding monooxygenase-like domain-containing protein [Trichoderma breve]|uniref:Flavin-binding monooxygenase-like domain-containing protein n=1 Tax=Trichoderma breve TaxID=2034170 RepID=A0A9W9B3A4_9HYPO|nr:flavin-binding monooxygenase-like domain-containing protein [Trichoderma breve]KAJ4854534.1 flavin-binding monooxygenase-like domain-containing protein [Trichoderma breve]